MASGIHLRNIKFRRRIFREVAKSAKLQHLFLDVLSNDEEAQKTIFRELSKNTQLKRRFVVVAHEHKKLRGVSDSRCKLGNL